MAATDMSDRHHTTGFVRKELIDGARVESCSGRGRMLSVCR